MFPFFANDGYVIGESSTIFNMKLAPSFPRAAKECSFGALRQGGVEIQFFLNYALSTPILSFPLQGGRNWLSSFPP
jgi:hypothetical protein